MTGRLMLAGAAIGVLSVAGPAAQAPAAPPAGTGLVVGRLVDAAGGAPVTGAIVTLTGAGVPARRVIVDAQGRFMFRDLPAGGFAITAAKSGYLDGAFGKQRPDGAGRSLDLREGERVTDATLKMWRFSAISGTVIDDAGDPVGGARVQALRRTMVAGHWRYVSIGIVAQTSTLYAQTDERGVYRIPSLTPGEYLVVLPSYLISLPVSLLQQTEAAQQAGGQTSSLFIRDITAKGAIMARDLGFPMIRLGDMMLEASGYPTGPTPSDPRSIGMYPSLWYPAATSAAQATPVSLKSGDDRGSVDFHPRLTGTVRVSGTVAGPAGPIPNMALDLVPAGLDDVAAETTFRAAMTASDALGAFTFMGVPPGQYTIRGVTSPFPVVGAPAPAMTVVQGTDGVQNYIPNAPAQPPVLGKDDILWTAVPVSVGNRDLSDVSVMMRRGLRVIGRVEFEGSAARPTPQELRAIRVSVEQADGRTVAPTTAYRSQVEDTGAFYTVGLIAGRYFIRVTTAPRNWTFKSAVINGRDVADTPLVLEANDADGLVITFTDRPSGLAGTVRNAQGAADQNATVLVFPHDPAAWTDIGANPRRLRSSRPSRDGAFMVPGMPPGDYDVVAVSDEIAANWQDPAFLRTLSRVATRVAVVEGQTASVDLRTAQVAR